eukprot:s5505_g2.t1
MVEELLRNLSCYRKAGVVGQPLVEKRIVFVLVRLGVRLARLGLLALPGRRGPWPKLFPVCTSSCEIMFARRAEDEEEAEEAGAIRSTPCLIFRFITRERFDAEVKGARSLASVHHRNSQVYVMYLIEGVQHLNVKVRPLCISWCSGFAEMQPGTDV